MRFPHTAPKPARGHIANVIREIWVHRPNAEWNWKLLERRGWRIRILLHLPRDAREVVGQLGGAVRKPVPFFYCQIPAPVADLDVALEKTYVGERLSKLVSYTDGFFGASRDVIVRAVGEGAALLLRVLLFLGIWCGEDCVVWDVGRGEFDLGLLLLSNINRGSVCAESILDILFVQLVDGGGDRAQGGEYGV